MTKNRRFYRRIVMWLVTRLFYI